jgi:hypothetical protein
MQLDNLLYLNKQKSSLDYMFWKLGVVGKRASLPFYFTGRKLANAEQMLSKC